MNTRMIVLSALTVCALGSSIAFANEIPSNSMQMSRILENIKKDGVNIIKKIELDNGKYEAKAINNTGNEIELEINAQTGEILQPTKSEDMPKLSIFDAVTKVEAAGYKNIYKIEANKNKYEVKAYDKNNKKVSLDMDATTGIIKD